MLRSMLYALVLFVVPGLVTASPLTPYFYVEPDGPIPGAGLPFVLGPDGFTSDGTIFEIEDASGNDCPLTGSVHLGLGPLVSKVESMDGGLPVTLYTYGGGLVELSATWATGSGTWSAPVEGIVDHTIGAPYVP